MELKEDKVNMYLNRVCSLIKNKRVHEEIKLEMKSHIEDLENQYKRKGIEGDKAMELALKEMGSPTDIGEKLNKVHKAKIDFKLIVCSFILLIFGILSAYSFENSFQAGTWGTISVVWYGMELPSGEIVVRDLFFTGLGILFLIGGIFFDFRKIRKLSIGMYILSIVLCILVYFNQKGMEHPEPLFVCGPINLYMLPIVAILFLFAISGFYKKIDWNSHGNLWIAGFIGIFPLILMRYTTNSVIMFVYYAISLSIITYVNSKNKRYTIIVSIINIALFFITTLGITINMIYGNQWNFQGVRTVLTNSKLIGAGGSSKFILGQGYPITNVIYTYGWLVGIIIILSLLYFLWRIIRIAYASKSNYGKSLGFVIATIISVEVIWSILMNLNMLPFASAATSIVNTGGQSIVLNLFLIGLLINIYKGKTITN